MEQLDLMKFIYGFALLSILLTALLTRSTYEKNIPYVNYILIWATVFTLGLVFYMMKEELSEYLNPSDPIVTADDIKIRRSYDNHFYLEAEINSNTVTFLIDTGASNISLSFNDALRLGINTDELIFNIPVNTANGQIFLAPIVIPEIHIGNAIFKDVKATVIPKEPRNQTSIFGLSFLDLFDYYIVDNDILILKF